MSQVIKLKIKDNWNGKYRLEYDSKYITLFGEDKNYECWNWGGDPKRKSYEEMVLVSCVVEGRNLNPSIIKVTKKYILIDVGNENASLSF